MRASTAILPFINWQTQSQCHLHSIYQWFTEVYAPNNIDSLLKEYGYNGMNAIVMNGNGLAQMNVMNGMNAIVMNGVAMNQMN